MGLQCTLQQGVTRSRFLWLIKWLLSWAFSEVKIATCRTAMLGHLRCESLAGGGGVCKDFQGFSFLLPFGTALPGVCGCPGCPLAFGAIWQQNGYKELLTHLCPHPCTGLLSLCAREPRSWQRSVTSLQREVLLSGFQTRVSTKQARSPRAVGQEPLLQPPKPPGMVAEDTTPSDGAMEGDQPALGETLSLSPRGWLNYNLTLVAQGPFDVGSAPDLMLVSRRGDVSTSASRLDSLCREDQLGGRDSARLAADVSIPPKVTLNKVSGDEIAALSGSHGAARHTREPVRAPGTGRAAPRRQGWQVALPPMAAHAP